MSKLTFSTIPDVCLLLVFDKIPLNDLLRHVNLVNRDWNSISGVACQHRKRLVISLLPRPSCRDKQTKAFNFIINSIFSDPFEVNKNKNRYYGGEHESLAVPKAQKRLNRESIERLIERLPNTSTLEVNLCNLPISSNKHLVTLITGWREHLVTLKLFTFYYGNYTKSLFRGLAQLTNLHTTINSLPVLHHLTYQLDFPFFKDIPYQTETSSFTFPISCPSLRELYFTSTDFLDNNFYSEETIEMFCDAFRNYVQSAEGSRLRKAVCYTQQFYELHHYRSTSDLLASKTTHIDLDCTNNITETDLMNFCRKFVNLTYISFEIEFDFTMDQFSKCLSILEHLTHVTVRYIGYRTSPMENEQLREAWLDAHSNRAKPQPNRITPLTQIKSVQLQLSNLRWHQYLTEDLCIDLIFPNIEQIYIGIYIYDCIHCGHFNAEMMKTTRKPEWHNCIGSFLALIAKCDKLKRIEYKNGEDFKFCCSLDRFKLAWADFIN